MDQIKQETERQNRPDAPTQFTGVVVGILVGKDANQSPLVAFPGNPQENAVVARSTVALTDEHMGKEIALLFEGGDPEQPIVIGPIEHPDELDSKSKDPSSASADIDGERIVLAAKSEIVLKCGNASITLTKAGKVLIRGTYVLSRSAGVNRVKSGSIQLN